MTDSRRIRRKLGENTRAVHLPPPQTPAQTPIGLPIWRSSTWSFDNSAEYADVLADRTAGFAYSRIDNPTVAAFADGVAALEGAAAPEDVAGQAFCSGLAAITTVFMTFLRSGSHVVAPSPVFSGTQSLLKKVLSRFGVTADFVDYSDLRRPPRHARRTRSVPIFQSVR